MPTYAHLGERVGQILALADAEAAEIRDRVVGEVEALRKDAEVEAGAVRAEADRYADETRRDAEADPEQRAEYERALAEKPRREPTAAERRHGRRVMEPVDGDHDVDQDHNGEEG